SLPSRRGSGSRSTSTATGCLPAPSPEKNQGRGWGDLTPSRRWAADSGQGPAREAPEGADASPHTLGGGRSRWYASLARSPERRTKGDKDRREAPTAAGIHPLRDGRSLRRDVGTYVRDGRR